MRKDNLYGFISIAALIVIFGAHAIYAQSSEFSYQGFLSDASASANGSFDFEFRLFDAVSGGASQGTIQRSAVPVTNGVFSVSLDFGAGAFPGADRFLEIAVKPSGGGGLTTLAPRQKIGRTPYAVTALNSANLGGVGAGNYVLTTDARLADSRNPLPNSSSYVQNRTTLQTSTSFNISGDGTVGGTLTGNIVSAGTQFNSGNNRLLAKFGQNNLYVGTLAGAANGGIQNTMTGDGAGQDNTGNENVFLGFVTGQRNTTGINNTFLGSRAGKDNTLNTNNTFVGYSSGATNNLTNATAIGANAFVEQNNTIVLGSINGVNGATATTDVGIGVTTPARRLDVNGNVRIGSLNSAIGCIEDRDGTVIAGFCSSDVRFKKDITTVGGVLKNFARLRPVNFYWRADEFADRKFGSRQSYGLIAQEVEEAFPELVSTDEQGFKMVNYTKLPLYTVQAVNELKAENDALKSQLERQQAEIDALKKAVQNIQQTTAQPKRKSIRAKSSRAIRR